MSTFRLLVIVLCLSLSACVVTYTLVEPGSISVDALTVQASAGWNRLPATKTPSARRDSETWTRDGVLLDRIVIIPSVPDGDAILRSRNESAALPRFKADMLPNEIEELLESSLVKTFGEGRAAVSTENLRPHRFGVNNGVMFDFVATVAESPEYRGLVGAFVANDRLYVLYFAAALPYYFDKHYPQAEALIMSAKL